MTVFLPLIPACVCEYLQMSAGLSTPVSRWALPAGRSSHRTSTPAANSMCNGQPQPLVAGTLLFPVQRLRTVYQHQLNCVCRHCPRPPLHDSWKRISSSALNDMCLQRVWFYLGGAAYKYHYYYYCCVVSLKVLFLVHYSSLYILLLSVPLFHRSPWTITFVLTTHNFSFPSIHRILT